MIYVTKDGIDLLIRFAGSSVILKFKRVDRAHVVFKPNEFFWGLWHGGRKRQLKDHRLSVDKNGKDYEVFMPTEWYKHQLTSKGLEKFELAKESKK